MRDSEYRGASMHTVDHQFRTQARNAFVIEGSELNNSCRRRRRRRRRAEAPDFTRPLHRDRVYR